MNINRSGDYFIIPISLCQHALKYRLLKELYLYCAMKVISSGQLVLDINTKKELACKMNVTVKTVENIFHKLIATNWIRRHGQNIYLQKFDFIANAVQGGIKTGVQFYPDDLLHFRAFTIGAVMGYLANMQELRLRNERRLGLLKKRGNNSTKRRSFHPIANKALAQILRCSIGTAHAYKIEAEKHKYIQVKKQFYIFDNIPPENIKAFIRSHPELSGQVFIRKGKVVKSSPDLIAPLLKYKARKKLKHRKGGYGGNR